MAKAKGSSKRPGQGTTKSGVDQRQFDQLRRDHANGLMATEDYIWAAMQCYAAQMRSERQ